ncbi:hypothetical protein CT19431_MP130040 [Cupriavidus taiwanensis]|nr:hypothetical protein CT19431_MP130040 [Cupriavidus taiwanensis]
MQHICNFVVEDVNAGYVVMTNVSTRHIFAAPAASGLLEAKACHVAR